MNASTIIRDVYGPFEGPSFDVQLWDGTTQHFGTDRQSTPAFVLVIHDEETLHRLLAQGSLGFGEAYMDGRLEIMGDLDAYLRLRRQFKRVRRSIRLMIATALAHWTIPRNRRDQIRAHYDIENDFFALILDNESMSYSAGYSAQESETLQAAQQAKLERITKWLNLPKNATVLDLGCGWGGFARYAAAHQGWTVTGYTLSRQQLSYCQSASRHTPTNGQLTFLEQDMTAPLPQLAYDGIVSIESIEHVGQRSLGKFMGELYTKLKPGAPLYLQTSGRYVSKRFDRWTQKYVFPGGYLPTKDELLGAAKAAGLVVEFFADDTSDYVRTLQHWIENLERHRSSIEQQYGSHFFRRWELWMHGAKVDFEVGSMHLFRLGLRRPG